MTYPQAIEFLYSLRMFGTKLGLENTFKLAALAANPHEKLRFIHVAGTNGKGSTCAMLESIYRSAGLRLGLFTSPHLVAFGERIQVDRKPVSETDVVRLLAEVRPLLKAFPPEAHPTFFEVVTIMALRYFVEKDCALVVWETGLGGRLDATNIVTPLASVITLIALDHEQWLGGTIEKIALEKAGIIKPGRPVITSAAPGLGLEKIVQTAHEHKAPITVVDWKETTRSPLGQMRLPLRGDFQRLNAAAAIATARVLNDSIPVSDQNIVDGLTRVEWPGRMQLLERANGQRILLDGAHNPAGAEMLRMEAAKQFAGAKPAIIAGILRDKDWHSMAALLAPIAGRLMLTPVNSERTLPPEELLPVCQQANPAAPAIVCHSLAEALKEVAHEKAVIITGSLYLVGEAMELLGLCGAAPEERSLNEWGAHRT